MRAISTTLVTLMSVISVASLPAQSVQLVPEGARVRITMATAAPTVVIGDLIAVSDSTVSVRRQDDAGDVTIPRALVHRLELSAGFDRGASARKGGVIGLVIGAVVGFAAGEDCTSEDFICFDRSETGFAGAALGVGVGGLLGYMGGGAERWRDSDVPVRLSVVPSGGRSVSIVSRILF
jgi:hypothetical protein